LRATLGGEVGALALERRGVPIPPHPYNGRVLAAQGRLPENSGGGRESTVVCGSANMICYHVIMHAPCRRRKRDDEGRDASLSGHVNDVSAATAGARRAMRRRGSRACAI
jgi:hypothetical protein